MTVTMNTADKVLKTAYLDVVSEYLDYNANAFLSKIKKTTDNVWGKEIKKLVKAGINGGISAGSEDGELPESYANMYNEFVIGLKNLYGTIELSDKAIRASENKSGAFTSLLNEEINSLMHAANINFSRMLFGDGSGRLGSVSNGNLNSFVTDQPQNFIEGMPIQFRDMSGTLLHDGKVFRVQSVDIPSNKVYVYGVPTWSLVEDFDGSAYVNNAYNNELTGLMSLFDRKVGSVYGVGKDTYKNLFPRVKENAGTISENMIQAQIDEVEERSGGKINFILCSSGVKRAFIDHLSTYKRNVETMEVAGGHKTVSFNGIPVVSDRFCPKGWMFLLNTDDFAIHQLCDWEWIEGEDGRILRQLENKPVYRATLVKYAELLCSRPWAQTAISGITEA
ncbi:MAG: phage major capsid protein [Clostridiales bacterium]|nr:phage major capsid protein [Clostridiales bacterium]